MHAKVTWKSYLVMQLNKMVAFWTRNDQRDERWRVAARIAFTVVSSQVWEVMIKLGMRPTPPSFVATFVEGQSIEAILIRRTELGNNDWKTYKTKSQGGCLTWLFLGVSPNEQILCVKFSLLIVLSWNNIQMPIYQTILPICTLCSFCAYFRFYLIRPPIHIL